MSSTSQLSLEADLSEDIICQIKDDILTELDTLIRIVLTDKIGDLDGFDTAADYVKSITYNSIKHTPIENLQPALTETIIAEDLDDGIYKIMGQYKICKNDNFSNTSIEDSLFIVNHDSETEDKHILILSGESIFSYAVALDGKCKASKYVTEAYLTEENYMSASNVHDYIQTALQEIKNDMELLFEDKIAVLEKKLSEAQKDLEDLMDSVDKLEGIL